jgi:hypothetical protein
MTNYVLHIPATGIGTVSGYPVDKPSVTRHETRSFVAACNEWAHGREPAIDGWE